MRFYRYIFHSLHGRKTRRRIYTDQMQPTALDTTTAEQRQHTQPRNSADSTIYRNARERLRLLQRRRAMIRTRFNHNDNGYHPDKLYTIAEIEKFYLQDHGYKNTQTTLNYLTRIHRPKGLAFLKEALRETGTNLEAQALPHTKTKTLKTLSHRQYKNAKAYYKKKQWNKRTQKAIQRNAQKPLGAIVVLEYFFTNVKHYEAQRLKQVKMIIKHTQTLQEKPKPHEKLYLVHRIFKNRDILRNLQIRARSYLDTYTNTNSDKIRLDLHKKAVAFIYRQDKRYKIIHQQHIALTQRQILTLEKLMLIFSKAKFQPQHSDYLRTGIRQIQKWKADKAQAEARYSIEYKQDKHYRSLWI